MENKSIDTAAVRALGLELPDLDKVFSPTIEKIFPKTDDEIKYESALKTHEMELKKLQSLGLQPQNE
jgi:hypothetical protein